MTAQDVHQEPIRITAPMRKLFESYATSAYEWSGTPLVSDSAADAAARDPLLDAIEDAGLVVTEIDTGGVWLSFTPRGRDYAAAMGKPQGTYAVEWMPRKERLRRPQAHPTL